MKKGKKLQYMILTVFAMMFCIGIYTADVKAAEPVNVEVPVKITLNGTLPEKAEDFIIKLEADDEAFPMPEGTIKNIYSMTINGAGSKNLPALTFDNVGIYSYRVWQEAGTNTKCTYDNAIYTLTVYVENTDDYAGLQATVTLYKDSEDEKQTEIEFHNIYETEVPKTGDTANTQIWIILAALSIACIGYSTKRKLSK